MPCLLYPICLSISSLNSTCLENVISLFTYSSPRKENKKMYVSRYALHISGNIQFSLQDLYFFYMWKWYRNKSRSKIMVRRWGRKGISFLQHTKIDNNIQFLYYYYFFNFLFLLLLLLSASAAAGTADTHHHIFLILNFLFRFEFFIRQRRKKKKNGKNMKIENAIHAKFDFYVNKLTKTLL